MKLFVRIIIIIIVKEFFCTLLNAFDFLVKRGNSNEIEKSSVNMYILYVLARRHNAIQKPRKLLVCFICPQQIAYGHR